MELSLHAERLLQRMLQKRQFVVLHYCPSPSLRESKFHLFCLVMLFVISRKFSRQTIRAGNLKIPCLFSKLKSVDGSELNCKVGEFKLYLQKQKKNKPFIKNAVLLSWIKIH